MFRTDHFKVHPEHQAGIFINPCTHIGYVEYSLCSQFPSLLIAGTDTSPLFVCQKIEDHYLQIARITYLVHKMLAKKFKFTFRDVKIDRDDIRYNFNELNLNNHKVTLDNVLIASINKILATRKHHALEAVPYVDGDYDLGYFDIKSEDIVHTEMGVLMAHRTEFSAKVRATLRGW